jgi:hypothetical protein
MLSLTKKSDALPAAAEHWHTNFRNFERLPDTKVVRTTFFVNTAAIAIAAGLLLWLASREMTNRGIQDQITEARQQIEANRKQNADAIRLSKAFAADQNKLAEAARFVRAPFDLVAFVDRLGRTLPKEIVIDFVESRTADPKKSIVTVRGRAAGSPDQASGIASAYVDQLRADATLSSLFDPITLTRIDRNADGTHMAFEISLNLKEAK